MASFTVTWQELLIVVILVLAIYAGEMLLFVRTSQRPRSGGDKAGAEARNALPSVQAEFVRLQAQVTALHAQLESMQREIDTLRSRQHSSGHYREAVDMAQHGTDAQAIAENCGISRAEAELIAALHRARDGGVT